MTDPVFAREIAWRAPVSVAASLAGAPGLVFLDSATAKPGAYDDRARHSYVACAPCAILRPDRDPLGALDRALAARRRPARAGLPPFQGGAIGYFGYELGGALERLPAPKPDPLKPPDLTIGLYDEVVAFDHRAERAWILSRRGPRAIEDLAWRIDQPARTGAPAPAGPIIADRDRAGHMGRVRRTIDHILAGDIFQANIALRFRAAYEGDPFALFAHLRAINPAPFSAFLDFGDIAIASASPERFLRLIGDAVETRPIKGTIRRDPDPAQDARAARALMDSAKDRAENAMIVDLLRNDLSKVARDFSVDVPAFCALESFAEVHHLVSTVTARLREGLGALDLLSACFPGGSITGAPKIRAMEIIHDLEDGPRGPYCGAIGWIDDGGAMDTAITIRTIWIRQGVATFQAGGGITARSDPGREYDEARAKGAALARALGEDWT